MTQIRQEGQPLIEGREGLLRGRTILITGGATNTGLEFARIASMLEPTHLVLMTRSNKHYDDAIEELKINNVSPFIADITDPEQITHGLNQLSEAGIAVTDVIHSAAAGMELFSRDMMKELLKLRKLQGDEYESTLAQLRGETIPAWVGASEDMALDVNFNGPRKLLDAIKNRVLHHTLPPRVRFVDFTSTWADGYHDPRTKVPGFYDGVARTKKAFQDYISDQGETLAGEGIHTTVIVGALIKDSTVGNMLHKFVFPLAPSEQQEIVDQTSITKKNMVDAALQALTEPIQPNETYPHTLYIIGQGEGNPPSITSQLPSDSPMYDIELPF